jgi:hypothetical protein
MPTLTMKWSAPATGRIGAVSFFDVLEFLHSVATGDDEEVELLAAAASYFSSRVFCLV